MGYPFDTDAVTIASGAALSTVANLNGKALVGIVIPDAWTASSLTFQASLNADGSDPKRVRDGAGNEVVVSGVAADDWVPIQPGDFAGIRYLILRSGTAAAAVNQGGDRVVTLVTRGV